MKYYVLDNPSVSDASTIRPLETAGDGGREPRINYCRITLSARRCKTDR